MEHVLISSIPAERQKQVQNYIIAHGSAQIKELADTYQISEATVRRDLDEISRKGLIQRTHGGAIAYNNNSSFERKHGEKMELMVEEKRRIGAYAASMVRDGDTIVLDSGTTTYAMSKCLATKEGITLITNDLVIANQIELAPSATLIIVPGQRMDNTRAIYGFYAESFLQDIKANKVFMASDALDLDAGATNANVLEVGLKKAMLDAARECILLVDSSKFEKQATFRVCPISRFDTIISDSGLSEKNVKRYGKTSELILV